MTLAEGDQSRNPFSVCTWQDVSGCTDCPIDDALNCRFDWGALLYFLAGFLPGDGPHTGDARGNDERPIHDCDLRRGVG
ncbi:unnamed protein product [marine sediment metagenome]|uniref:Uncharacterized protein n=1 Tax=marine sediment metagenome TaxID=412755 RepID=X1QA63_9ZZZZ